MIKREREKFINHKQINDVTIARYFVNWAADVVTCPRLCAAMIQAVTKREQWHLLNRPCSVCWTAARETTLNTGAMKYRCEARASRPVSK